MIEFFIPSFLGETPVREKRIKAHLRQLKSMKKLPYKINILAMNYSLEERKLFRNLFPRIKFFDVSVVYNIGEARNFLKKQFDASTAIFAIFLDNDILIDTKFPYHCLAEKTTNIPIIFPDFVTKFSDKKEYFDGLFPSLSLERRKFNGRCFMLKKNFPHNFSEKSNYVVDMEIEKWLVESPLYVSDEYPWCCTSWKAKHLCASSNSSTWCEDRIIAENFARQELFGNLVDSGYGRSLVDDPEQKIIWL